jgi:hypothetical protein
MESFWGDVHRRSRGDEIRKENDITNINQLVPIDMGVSVLWADTDLILKTDDNTCYFTYNDAKIYGNDSGWRLPTPDEVNELFENTTVLENSEKYIIESKSENHSQLVFDKKGVIIVSGTIYHNGTQYNAWVSPDENNPFYNSYRIMKDYKQKDVKIVNMHPENMICIRVVKDK